MTDNVAITPGSGATIACDEVIDGTLGTVKVQIVKVMDGTLDSTNKMVVDSSGRVATLPSFHDSGGTDMTDTGNHALKVNVVAGGSIVTSTVAKVLSASGAPAAVAIKASAGSIQGWWLYCSRSTPVFVKFYNVAAGSVTVGTTTPAFTIGVSPGAVSNGTALAASFGTAISYAITGLVTESDATAVAANDLVGAIMFT